MSRYIDADDLLNALKEERKNGNFVFTSKWIKEIIDKLPTADVVEVRHGHWKYLWFYAVCSECGYINKADAATRCRTDPPCCPNCGAKMDGERREE